MRSALLTLISAMVTIACTPAEEPAAAVTSDVVEDVAAPTELPPSDARAAEHREEVCAPSCPLSRCGAGDGCEGSCPACPATENCADCALKLHVLEQQETGGVVTRVTLALDYAPGEQMERPRLAEFRVATLGTARWLSVTAGAAVEAAGKSLAPDPQSGEPFQVLADGTLRVVVLSDNDQRIDAGRLLELELLLGAPFEPPTEPVVVRLTHDEPIFAPPASDILDPAVLTPLAFWPPEAD
jgi:hypothetical protein